MQASLSGWQPAPSQAPPEVLCAHCGAAVPGSEASAELSFCCAGCRAVYGAIHEAGLEAYYQERGREIATAAPPSPTGRRYDDLDTPEALACAVDTARGRSVELHLEGVHCAACVWLVESLPRVVSGVRDARLDFGRATVEVTWDPSTTTLSAVARALDRLGYRPHLGTASAPGAVDRGLLMRLGVAGAIAGNVMLMALALYSGALPSTEADYQALFRWGSLALALPAVLYCASPFYRGALAALRARVPNMDVPIALGISAGALSGAVNTFRGSGEVFFDTVTVLIFLLLVGRVLQQRYHRRAASSAEVASALSPNTASVVDGEQRRELRAHAVPAGVLVEVLSGERVPVDGRIERGESAIDASLLTGESAPIDVKTGDRVYAGTENLSGPLLVRTEVAGNDTRVAKLVSAMKEAEKTRAPIVRLADEIAGRFVMAVVALALLTLALWWSRGAALAVDHAVALLVVTCPCALGMATPLAVSVALGRAARRGILIKGGEALEALARARHFIFDKTGTLTAGRPELLAWEGAGELGVLASRAERGCDHPLARALARAFPAPDGPLASALERRDGAGVRARVAGREVAAGSQAFMESLEISVPRRFARAAAAHAEQGLTPVMIAVDGEVGATAGFGDALRADAAPSLAALEELGIRPTVLSGDHPAVVGRVCGELRIDDFAGSVSPEQKLARVRDEVARGETVVMVGDGVNDAAALAAATVGFAVHGGAEASLLAASAFATRPGVAPVLEAVMGARSALATIRRGIYFSLAYNAVGVALAMSGLLSPLVAALLMPASSLTVVTSALRSGAFRPRAESPRSPGP